MATHVAWAWHYAQLQEKNTNPKSCTYSYTKSFNIDNLGYVATVIVITLPLPRDGGTAQTVI